MKAYFNSEMLAYSDGGLDRANCEVRIDDTSIVVSYDTEDGPVVYAGSAEGAGHYKLKARGVNGEATLHCFAKGKVLDGWWRENGEDGMWRIWLA